MVATVYQCTSMFPVLQLAMSGLCCHCCRLFWPTIACPPTQRCCISTSGSGDAFWTACSACEQGSCHLAPPGAHPAVTTDVQHQKHAVKLVVTYQRGYPSLQGAQTSLSNGTTPSTSTMWTSSCTLALPPPSRECPGLLLKDRQGMAQAVSLPQLLPMPSTSPITVIQHKHKHCLSHSCCISHPQNLHLLCWVWQCFPIIAGSLTQWHASAALIFHLGSMQWHASCTAFPQSQPLIALLQASRCCRALHPAHKWIRGPFQYLQLL